MFCSKCGHLAGSCVCVIRETHDPKCRYRIAAELSIELPCDHGYQACPICDPCTCKAGGAIPLI